MRDSLRSALGPGYLSRRSSCRTSQPARLPRRPRLLRLLVPLDRRTPNPTGRPLRHGAISWRDYFRVNTDHKVIGVQYLVTTFSFFFIAGLLAMLMRAELAQPGTQFVDTQTFNGLFSTHAVLMIFLFIVPVFAGIANYVLPLMIGAPDMAFPRLNALSFWLLPIAGLIMLSGWPARGRVRRRLDELRAALQVSSVGNLDLPDGRPVGRRLFDPHRAQLPGDDHHDACARDDVLAHAPARLGELSTSLLVVLATPFIAGSQFKLLLDRVLHTNFFVFRAAGVVGYQHIFWFYSHPAVYIMMLPGFGIVSEVISAFARKPIFGYRLMALSLIAILVLGFSVWAHHMFVAGMAPWLRIPMMVTTLLIAVPTGIKIFSWLATLWEGRIPLSTAMLWAIGFIIDVRDRRDLRASSSARCRSTSMRATRTSSSPTSTTCSSAAPCSRSSRRPITGSRR